VVLVERVLALRRLIDRLKGVLLKKLAANGERLLRNGWLALRPEVSGPISSPGS
jgi:hypothetical protein